VPEQDDAHAADPTWASPDPEPAPAGPQQGPGQQPWGPPQQPGPRSWGGPPQGPQPWAGQPWGPPRQPGQQPWAGQPWGLPQQPGQQPWSGQPWGPPLQPGQQPWGWEPPDPRAKRRKRLLAIGSIVGVVALLLGLLVGVDVYEERRAERIAAEVEALLPDLQAFVAEARGLPFLEEVDVEVLGDDAFLDALFEAEEGAPEPARDRDSEATLKALGLLEEDADLDERVTESLEGGVVGFYDPTTDRLVVRGQSVSAFVELVLVHELVHALQDQHLDLDRPELDEADDERSIAFTSLVEGDATRVETLWFEAQSGPRQREIARAVGGLGGGLGDAEVDVVESLLGFPYLSGPGYVEALLEQGGQEALDAAFADPPTTTEQILRPGRDLDVVEVARPEPDGDVLDEGVLGALGIDLLAGVDVLDPTDSVEGWRGDRYVTYQDGDRACTLAHVAGDQAQLRPALDGWAADRADAEVGDGPDGTLRLRACV
jgi:hypothetical protein